MIRLLDGKEYRIKKGENRLSFGIFRKWSISIAIHPINWWCILREIGPSMNSRSIRTKFFDFFIARNHTKVASSSLIPAEDPTLLFANAGMNQFKDLFLGKVKRSYTRAVSIQNVSALAASINDLENVGFTRRHLTFFEMMGTSHLAITSKRGDSLRVGFPYCRSWSPR